MREAFSLIQEMQIAESLAAVSVAVSHKMGTRVLKIYLRLMIWLKTLNLEDTQAE